MYESELLIAKCTEYIARSHWFVILSLSLKYFVLLLKENYPL